MKSLCAYVKDRFGASLLDLYVNSRTFSCVLCRLLSGSVLCSLSTTYANFPLWIARTAVPTFG
jgi:hypothetical protein